METETKTIHELHSKKVTFLWLLLRYYNEQIIPGWTGFNHEITDIADDNIHTVTYLPTIPKSPTKVETIQEILIQIKLKSEKLGLTCVRPCNLLEVLRNHHESHKCGDTNLYI